MKANRIFIALLLALPALFLQSCLKDQEDVFDSPYSKRVSDFLQQAQDTLVKAPYGWALDYYPESNQSYGGVAYTIRFTRDNAIVRYENNPDDGEVKSRYSMKDDSGPVLSFDTYNDFLHVYATPKDGEYRGKEGDFEFVIDSIGSDRIKLRGKKSENTMYLRKLTADAAEYMEKVTEVSADFIFSEMKVTVGGKPYSIVITDLDNRQLALYDGNTLVGTSAYAFTDHGIRLYLPVTVNGVRIQDFTYDSATAKLSAGGVETTESFVDVNAIARLIGSVSVSNGAKTITKTVPHLDKLQLACDASWVHLSKDGNTLTIAVDANPMATKARGSKIKVSNGTDEAQVQVLQYDLPALLGSYKLTMTAYDPDAEAFRQTTRNAKIRYTGSGKNRKYFLNVESGYGADYIFPLTYVQSANAFLMQSGQKVITLHGQSKTYYIGNAFNINKSQGTGVGTNAYNLISFEISDNGDIRASLCGPLFVISGGQLQYTGLTTQIIVLYAFTGEPFSESNLAGWWDKWQNAVIEKTSTSSPAKPAPLFDDDAAGSGHDTALPQYKANRVARFDMDWSALLPSWNVKQVKPNK
ncbi:DUF4302 domain-containing protein [Prevotella multiformis]|uniref:DUF4302 domain-containing protein n=1 Tax=Prevotella multiformis TaxID=282402 RepID=UPI001BA665DE|nr:DUF4302 domain-containing protein [Prevotella multiformis]QUB72229.1 DUF4302 domain-containing protein [Prevotella multiformis]